MARKSVYALTGIILSVFAAVFIISPVTGVVLVPIICLIAYYLARRLGFWALALAAMPFVSAAVFAGGGNLLFAVAAGVTVSLIPVRLFAKHIRGLWCETGICAAAAIVAVCAVIGFWALLHGVSVTDAITYAYETLTYDYAATWMAKAHYLKLTAEDLGRAPLSVKDEMFTVESMREFANFIGRELDGATLWYLTGFGAFTGGLSCLGAAAAANCDGGERTESISELRLSRTYLAAAVLPALAFMLFSLYEPMRPAVRTVVNLMITLPTAVCGITLLYHSLSRICGKPKIAAIIGFWLVIAVAALFYEWGLLILGFIGLADCIINVRRLLDWALSP